MAQTAKFAVQTCLITVRARTINETKMSDGGRGRRASLEVKVWNSSQKWSVQRSAVRSIAWLGFGGQLRDRVAPVGLDRLSVRLIHNAAQVNIVAEVNGSDHLVLVGAESFACRVCPRCDCR